MPALDDERRRETWRKCAATYRKKHPDKVKAYEQKRKLSKRIYMREYRRKNGSY